MTKQSISEKIGKKICALRKKSKISQKKLGELAGLSKTSINKIERGISKPFINTLDKIASVLNIELKDLVDTTNID